MAKEYFGGPAFYRRAPQALPLLLDPSVSRSRVFSVFRRPRVAVALSIVEMPSPFKIVIDGHGDIVGRRVLDCSETAFFSYVALCRATRGAVPRKVIDESLPGHLDAALRRDDEPAVRRLAGEAMRRVGRNLSLIHI